MASRSPPRETRKSGPYSVLVSATAAIEQFLTPCAPGSSPRGLLDEVAAESHRATGREYSAAETARMVAQLLVHARFSWLRAGKQLCAAAPRSHLLPSRASILGKLLHLATGDTPETESCEWQPIETLLSGIPIAAASFSKNGNGEASLDSYDAWLGKHQPRWRSKYGIFYTPRPIARYIVQQVDTELRAAFGLADGLADTTSWQEMISRNPALNRPTDTATNEPFVKILDPAAGGGVFLEEVIRSIHRSLQRKWEAAGWTLERRLAAWNEYVPRYLFPRLHGFELLLPQLALGWLSLIDVLARTGYDFHSSADLNLALNDTLTAAGSAKRSSGSFNSKFHPLGATAGLPSSAEGGPNVGSFAGASGFDGSFTVLVGNPPFAALAHVTSDHMRRLLRVTKAGRETLTSYFEVDGTPLRERKTWLHDDYVKFLRYAQWQIAQAGCGVVGFVTNHSYLDNVTFRGMRQSLLATFPQISIVDLHGSRKKWEVAPDGSSDENVFGIDQGVAIAVLSKPPQQERENVRQEVQYAELWGQRDAKLGRLADDHQPLVTQKLSPWTPYYFFVPQSNSDSCAAEYESGFSLHDIMPLHASVAVTARDSFVVAFTEQELSDRFKTLGELAIGDEEIRHRFFRSTRSRRYVRGDTRGWKLAAAREAAHQCSDAIALFRDVQYRPFDRRKIMWTEWLIDWPRSQVMRHMLEIENLALVTRRQMLAGQPCNFFFVTDTVVLDGLLRSDNRGNESFFPLYSTMPRERDNVPPTMRANFSSEFVERCSRQWSLEWLPHGAGDLVSTFGPLDLLGLIYGELFATSYRERYASCLRLAFPRVFLPRDVTLFRTLARLGSELIQLHLLQPATENGELSTIRVCGGSPVVVEGKYPLHDAETSQLYLSREFFLESVSEQVWQYRIGAHQVCRKWLRDRRGRALDENALATFCRVVRAIARTTQLTIDVDRTIDSAGGWPGAFVV